MEPNNMNRAPAAEPRPPSATPQPTPAVESAAPSPLPPRPQLTRADSRSGFVQQAPRPQAPQGQGPPLQPQQRPLQPQFQPGGAVTIPSQFTPRPGTPAPRGPAPAPGSQPLRPPQPQLRQYGPQSFAPQAPRLVQIPNSGQIPPRAPPPNNLQFGPRQPPQFGGGSTPDGTRPPIVQQTNGVPRNGVPTTVQPIHPQLPRQPSQGLIRAPDLNHTYKPVNLDNLSNINDNQNTIKMENSSDVGGIAKARSYSIAAAPGAPSPLKSDDDRRKSVSSIGGKIDEFSSRTPGLGLIQEGKIESKDNIRGSRESIRSEVSNDGRELPERPESRLSSSKMSDSFIGSLPQSAPKKKFDDNDDVVLNNNITAMKQTSAMPQNQSKIETYDRSPSLTRSDDSPENKNISNTIPNKQQNIQEPSRPKTPKAEIKPDMKSIDVKEMKPNPISNKAESRPIYQENKPPIVVQKKPNELNTTNISLDQSKKSTPRKSASAKSRQKDGDNDSGVDESTQGNDLNGSPGSPNKKLPSKLPTKEKSSNSIRMSLSRSSSKSATAKTPDPLPAEKKKVPMNKIQVGNAPSPNIKAVKSKIGSLENATYKPGGGKIKIENKKLEFGNVTPRIAAKNDKYVPSGGSKKITTTKLEWKAESKIGSLQNTSYKPGGGDKKIETVKLDFKDKAKPKVASTANITHKPGGGVVKIENQKLEFKAQSKVGSLDNVKYKPGGGEVKIFDDKEYLKHVGGQSPLPGSHAQSRQEDEYYTSIYEYSERPMSRCKSARAPRTPRTRELSPRKDDEVLRNNERNRRASRPMSAREPPRSSCSRRASVIGQRPAFTVY